MFTGVPVDLRQITKLHEMLEAEGIPHTFKNAFDGLCPTVEEDAKLGKQICYPVFDPNERVLSAICNIGSYGRESGLIEIMGLLTEEEEAQQRGVAGWLTAEDVFERIKRHWAERNVKQ